MTDRPILTTFKKPDLHWVGDGFLTQSLLPYEQHAHDTSPFILAGYNPPIRFEATNRPKGIGMHPHRGFETVTIAFQGGVTHGDTLGNKGTIGPGDVQWMTAARGVQHEEYHSDLINAEGGTLEMVQLWVNLPASEKMSAPRYQTITSGQIPTVELGGQSRLRVIAGAYGDVDGPAVTASPLHLWDVYLQAGDGHLIELPAGQTVSVALLSGQAVLNGAQELTGPETVIFTTEEGQIRLTATEDAHYLVLAGEPIKEPIAMGGPFVMNTEAELRTAYQDFRMGRF
ncbi:pirin family protein [Xinfangfangia sp. CPCC 101601]|uniref:Pirin family protein n=1 Tax=Pseudogemmobacter lacusdianii TaxID=3069608 RepID=A0ABU0W2P5_9RHOB|nr:pirin family protein [Xinfangfangia sp. CPCC 101601]MDQ2068241.1 pirin family protein [Xinfangfangia sp. CPCC 101601]